MKEICIIVAMFKEAEPIVKKLDKIIADKVCGKRVFYGSIAGRKVSVLVCGVGKVNAAMGAQIAYSHLSADIVINIGVAGGLNDSVKVGEIYEVCEAIQYDFDLSAINNTKVGTHDYFSTNVLRYEITQMNGKRLATADRFNDSKTDNMLLNMLNADIRDMEGAAILQVCYYTRLDCFCYKVISDMFGSGSSVEQYQKNMEKCLSVISEKITAIVKGVYE